jgi:hypothetical protein
MEALKRLKARHWDERIEGAFVDDMFFSPGYVVAPPLRRLARWARHQLVHRTWELIAAVIAVVGVIIALVK